MSSPHPLIAPPALFVSSAVAARMLHIAPRTVRDLVARGHLQAFHPVAGGRKYLLYAAEVQAYARARREGSDEAALANVRALAATLPTSRRPRTRAQKSRTR